MLWGLNKHTYNSFFKGLSEIGAKLGEPNPDKSINSMLIQLPASSEFNSKTFSNLVELVNLAQEATKMSIINPNILTDMNNLNKNQRLEILFNENLNLKQDLEEVSTSLKKSIDVINRLSEILSDCTLEDTIHYEINYLRESLGLDIEFQNEESETLDFSIESTKNSNGIQHTNKEQTAQPQGDEPSQNKNDISNTITESDNSLDMDSITAHLLINKNDSNRSVNNSVAASVVHIKSLKTPLDVLSYIVDIDNGVEATFPVDKIDEDIIFYMHPDIKFDSRKTVRNEGKKQILSLLNI